MFSYAALRLAAPLDVRPQVAVDKVALYRGLTSHF